MGIETVGVYAEATPARSTSAGRTAPSRSARDAARETYLSIPRILDAARDVRRRRDPSRLRVSLGERRVRAGGRERRPRLGRAAPGGDRGDGRQAARPRADGARRACPSCPARTTSRHATPRRSPRRPSELGFPAPRQGVGGRRRQGDVARRRAGGPRRRRSRKAGASRTRRSATTPSTSRSCSSVPRHVEFQVFGDRRGQRRAPLRARVQRPAPAPEDRRGDAEPRRSTPRCARAMGEAAVAAARAVGYVGAGTVEFLLDADRKLLLPGDEHAAPGRAPDHRGDARARPRARAARGRRGRRAARRPGATGELAPARPRDRDAPLRRGPRRVSAALGHGPRLRASRRGPGVRVDAGVERGLRRSASSTTRCSPSSSSRAPDRARRDRAGSPGARGVGRPRRRDQHAAPRGGARVGGVRARAATRRTSCRGCRARERRRVPDAAWIAAALAFSERGAAAGRGGRRRRGPVGCRRRVAARADEAFAAAGEEGARCASRRERALARTVAGCRSESPRRDGELVAIGIGRRRLPVRVARDGNRVFVWCAGAVFEFRREPRRRAAARRPEDARAASSLRCRAGCAGSFGDGRTSVARATSCWCSRP